MLYLIIVFMLDIVFLYSSLYELKMLSENSFNVHNEFYYFLEEDLLNNWYSYLLKYLLAVILLFFKEITTGLYIFALLYLMVLSFISIYKYQQKGMIKFTNRLLSILIIDYLVFIILEIVLAHLHLWQFISLLLVVICFNSYLLILISYILNPFVKKKQIGSISNAKNTLKDSNIKTVLLGDSSDNMEIKEILNVLLKNFKKGYISKNNDAIIDIANVICGNKEIEYLVVSAKTDDLKDYISFLNPSYYLLRESEDLLLSDNTRIIANKDNFKVKDLKYKAKQMIWYTLKKKSDIKVSNIKKTKNNLKFELQLKDELFKITTKHGNIDNIIISIIIADELGISKTNIITNLKNI